MHGITPLTQAQVERMEDETDVTAQVDLAVWVGAVAHDWKRLRAALEILAQVRHISGNAQPHMKQQLRLIDAVLLGADLRDVDTMGAVSEGKWTP